MKYVAVTGASGGMGKETVNALNNNGYYVIALDKSIYQERGGSTIKSGNIKLALTSKYSIDCFPGNDKKHLFWCLFGISLLSCINSFLFFLLRGIGNTDYCTFLGNCI